MPEVITASEFQSLLKGKDRSSVVELPRSRRVAAPSKVIGSRRGSGKQSEASIHQQFCAYVRNNYPDAIFTSESSGIRLTMGQAVKAKKLRSSSKLPDFWMAEPRGIFCGFFLELKRSRDEVFTKDGVLRQDDRIRGQHKIIVSLCEKGYYARFGFGLDDAIKKLDDYMNSRRPC